jgi:hypothetical protein
MRLLVGNVNLLFFVLLLILLSLLIYFFCRVSEPEPQVIEGFYYGKVGDWFVKAGTTVLDATSDAAKSTWDVTKDGIGEIKDFSEGIGVTGWLEGAGKSIRGYTYDVGDMAYDVEWMRKTGEGIKKITIDGIDELDKQIQNAKESEVAGKFRDWAEESGATHLINEFNDKVGQPVRDAAGNVILEVGGEPMLATALFVFDHWGVGRILALSGTVATVLEEPDSIDVLEVGLEEMPRQPKESLNLEIFKEFKSLVEDEGKKIITAVDPNWVPPRDYRHIKDNYCLPSSNDKKSNIGSYRAFKNIKDVKKSCDRSKDCDGFTHNKDTNKYILKKNIIGAYKPKKGNFDCYREMEPYTNTDGYCKPSSNYKTSNLGEYVDYSLREATQRCDLDPYCVGITHNKDTNKFLLKKNITSVYKPSKGNYNCFKKDNPKAVSPNLKRYRYGTGEYCIGEGNIGGYTDYDSVKSAANKCTALNYQGTRCAGFTHNKRTNKFLLKNNITHTGKTAQGDYDCYKYL